MKAKRDNNISELITLRITKAKAKENWEGGGGALKFTLKLAVMQKEISELILVQKKRKRKRKKTKKNWGK